MRRAMFAEQARRRDVRRQNQLQHARGVFPSCDHGSFAFPSNDGDGTFWTEELSSGPCAPPGTPADHCDTLPLMGGEADYASASSWRHGCIPMMVGLGMVTGAALGYDLADPAIIEELLRIEGEFLEDVRGGSQRFGGDEDDDAACGVPNQSFWTDRACHAHTDVEAEAYELYQWHQQ
jgi:hypothetical protein